jgi:hypothetical protein
MPEGPVIGEVAISGDFQFEHLIWALLAEDDAEYPPYHSIEERERSTSWGGFSEGVEIVIEVMNNPYISNLITSLGTLGFMEASKRIMDRVRSAPISEETAIHHARQWIAQADDVDAADIAVVGSGMHPKGARWVDLQTDSRRVRVGVALTSRGGVSVATESWEALTPGKA